MWGIFSLTGTEHRDPSKNPYNTLIMISDTGSVDLVYHKICPWVPKVRQHRQERHWRLALNARPVSVSSHLNDLLRMSCALAQEPWTAAHETKVAVGPKGIIVGGIICYDGDRRPLHGLSCRKKGALASNAALLLRIFCPHFLPLPSS